MSFPSDATREEAIKWAVANNCHLSAPVFPPPPGWQWADSPTIGVHLTPIFTNFDGEGDITAADILEAMETSAPVFVSKIDAVAEIGNMGEFDAATNTYSQITLDDLIAYANRIARRVHGVNAPVEANAVHDSKELA